MIEGSVVFDLGRTRGRSHIRPVRHRILIRTSQPRPKVMAYVLLSCGIGLREDFFQSWRKWRRRPLFSDEIIVITLPIVFVIFLVGDWGGW